LLKGLSRILTDEDSVITLIRITSIIIIFGCLIALSLHYFGSAEILVGDDDNAVYIWKNFFLIVINSLFLGRDIIRHELHRDHENSGQTYHNTAGTEFELLTPSSIYTIPESMPHI